MLGRTDPEKKRMTAECELLPPVGCGNGYGVNLLIINECDLLWLVLEINFANASVPVAVVRVSTKFKLNSNIVPVSMRNFAFRKAKEEAKTENLRLRATKTVPVFEDGGWETLVAPHLLVAKSKAKEKENKGKDRGS